MVQVRCVHCGATISGKNGGEISGTFCNTCWKLHEDSRKYARMGLPKVADYLKAVLSARKKKKKDRYNSRPLLRYAKALKNLNRK